MGRGEGTHNSTRAQNKQQQTRDWTKGSLEKRARSHRDVKTNAKEVNFLSWEGHSSCMDRAGLWLAVRKGISFSAALTTCSHPKSFSQLTKPKGFCVQGFYPFGGSPSHGKPQAPPALTAGKAPGVDRTGIPSPGTALFVGFSGARRSHRACPLTEGGFGLLSENNSSSNSGNKT